MRRRCLPTALFLLALPCLSGLRAELPVRPDADLFGDGMVQSVKLDQPPNGGMIIDGRQDSPTVGRSGEYRHVILFQDGRQLRGKVVAITESEVILSHPAATTPLHLLRSEVRKILLNGDPGADAAKAAAAVSALDENAFNGMPVRGTVKLAGADWLYGDISSRDGHSFEVRVGPRTVLTIPRTQIEWLQFDHQPAPAFGFFGNALDLDGWSGPRHSAPWAVADDGVLDVDSGKWVSRGLSTPARFEVDLELPLDSEKGTRLWLQPFALTNSYTTGTVQFEFSRSALNRMLFRNGFEERRSLLPFSSKSNGNTAAYRVFYDRTIQHVAVLRNGRIAGEWRLADNIGNNIGISSFDRQIRSISIDRNSWWGPGELRLKRLEVKPWDGLIPGLDDAPRTTDLLSSANDDPISGTLESVSGGVISFSGAEKQIRAGMFVEFPHRPEVLAQADGSLVFGGSGELRVAGLNLADGMAHFRTSFSEDAKMPMAALQTIALPPAASDPAPSDVLVFKNGDEIPGTLRSAGPGHPVHWQTASGQDVEFAPERIAGVRIAVGAPEETGTAATVELRNGDRLRGDLQEGDESQVKMRIPGLGDAFVKKDEVWEIFPNPELGVRDGTQSPEAWMDRAAKWLRESSGDTSGAGPSNSWVYLDGTYIPRGNPAITDRADALTLEEPALNLLERFEFQCTVTNLRGGAPMFSLGLTGFTGTPMVQASCFFGQLHIMTLNGLTWRRANSTQVPLADKLPDASSRVNVRVFVNSRTGTADFYLDGVPVAQIGHHTDEHLPKVGARIDLQPYAGSNDPMIFSDIRIGPWDGELPAPGVAKPEVMLTNGDTTEGSLKAIGTGKVVVDSEIGPIDLPEDKVAAIRFGGERKSAPVAARIRLRNGSMIQADAFQWDGDELTAHSAAMGELKISHADVSELILSPAPTRLPSPITAKPVLKKESSAAQHRAQVAVPF